MFSGGIGSWAAGARARERHPGEEVLSLFADTLIEDEDLYRFLIEATAQVARVDAANLAAEALRLPGLDRMEDRKAALADLARRSMARIPGLVWISEGRTPWDVFRETRFIGNSRVDKCSQHLKRELLDRWRDANLDPADTIVYVGIDWTEAHRFERLKIRLGGHWHVEAPMCEAPYQFKTDMLRAAAALGIRPPRLYALGFSHNNCGGFCIKAGHAHFANLLRTMPERYAFHEQQEESMRATLGDVAILNDRSGGGPRRPVSLRAFRERIASGGSYDLFDYGGCGCFVGGPTTDAASGEA
jgi:hypothetical protein